MELHFYGILQGISLIFIAGLLAKVAFAKIKLPGLVGMLLVGILIGPLLNVVSPALVSERISADFRELALIVILLRAGLEINTATFKKVKGQALLMSSVPAILEIIGVMVLGYTLLGLNLLESAILGAVLGAVSPAVLVTQMLDFIKRKRGTNKGIPQMLIVASSVDDVFVIVIFSALVAMLTSGLAAGNALTGLFKIPVSIVLGFCIGLGTGLLLVKFFKRIHMRDTIKLLIMISVSILFVWLENQFESIVPLSGYLAVMTMGTAVLQKHHDAAERMAEKFEKLWLPLEIILFILVGASLSIPPEGSTVAPLFSNPGLLVNGSLLIIGALVFRCAGVFLSLLGPKLNFKEKLFCMFAYIPKATVQAALCGVIISKYPAFYDVGLTIQIVALLSIIITAPLGAILISLTGKSLLHTETAGNEIVIDSNQLLIDTKRAKELINDEIAKDLHEHD